jgi:hypothetical protein
MRRLTSGSLTDLQVAHATYKVGQWGASPPAALQVEVFPFAFHV